MSLMPRHQPDKHCFVPCSPGTYCECLGYEIPEKAAAPSAMTATLDGSTESKAAAWDKIAAYLTKRTGGEEWLEGPRNGTQCAIAAIERLSAPSHERTKMPAECVGGCPQNQVCDYCQGTGGKDKAPRANEQECQGRWDTNGDYFRCECGVKNTNGHCKPSSTAATLTPWAPECAERLRLAMLFIEEWANWWSYSLGVDDSKVTPEMNAEAEKMAESLGARARDMVIDNRRFLASAGTPSAIAERKLDKPAQVGSTIFGVGVSERLVVERAQREHEYQHTPEKEAARMARVKDFRALLHGGVTEEMVSRFLSWPLPKDFAPDCGISFKPVKHPNGWPIGTNLLTAIQAKAMLEHVLGNASTERGAKP